MTSHIKSPMPERLQFLANNPNGIHPAATPEFEPFKGSPQHKGDYTCCYKNALSRKNSVGEASGLDTDAPLASQQLQYQKRRLLGNLYDKESLTRLDDLVYRCEKYSGVSIPHCGCKGSKVHCGFKALAAAANIGKDDKHSEAILEKTE